MNIEFIKSSLAGEPKYRIKQAMHAIFVELADSWSACSALPINLREKLDTECPISIDAQIVDSKKSESTKALITLEDGAVIETVLLNHKDGRRTVCVSSQVGCTLGCNFCATGKMGFKRDLTANEIVLQVLYFARYLHNSEKKHKRITNVVFMGMGEPFLNYDNVMSAVHILNDKDGLNIGARHISISTSGIIDGIRKFMKETIQVNLAVSLHAPTSELRSILMPVNRKYPLDKLLSVVREYADKKSRQVMFEYLMIDGINDTPKHARELADLMDHHLYVVNLIRYNKTGNYKPSTVDAIRKFKNILLREGVNVTERQAFGGDINAACGQLAGNKQK